MPALEKIRDRGMEPIGANLSPMCLLYKGLSCSLSLWERARVRVPGANGRTTKPLTPTLSQGEREEEVLILQEVIS